MKDLTLKHAIGTLGVFPSFGDAAPLRPQIRRAPRDLRLVAALLVWAVGFLSISYLVSFAHDNTASKTQADSWVCKRH